VVGTVVLALAIVAATGSYGALALSNHFEGAPPGGATLDATDFVDRAHPEEATAIRWVDGLEGQPTLASAPATRRYPGRGGSFPPGMYDWDSSPAASLTGVPTVAGWAHEVGYRGAEPYYDRVADVDDLYTGDPTTRARVLRTYDVDYVWVGPAERARYGDALAVGEGPGLRAVHQSGSVTIYEVRPGELGGSAGE
jgi:uncharacterized membrane protein